MSDDSKHHICIIGAGLTGLVSACALASAGYQVTVLESTLHSGGMVTSFNWGKIRLEYIYHHIFTSDNLIIRLIEKAGLSDQLKWFKTRDALFAQQQIHPFTTPLDLLKFPLIPLGQRIRTGLAVLKAGRLDNWSELERQTASNWLIRHGGEKAYTCIWDPLLRSKFDKDAEDVSAVWIWNKFKLRGSSRNQKAGSEKLGYLEGSFGLLIDKLVHELIRMGGTLLTGHTVMNISRSEDVSVRYQISCILEDCTTVHVKADSIIATVAGRQFAGITTSLDMPEPYRNQIQNVSYKGDLCLILRLKQKLSPYYWTTVCEQLPFVVVVEHTNLIDPDNYGGHIVYLSRYLDAADPLWTQPDNVIYQQFMAGLETIYPHFSPRDVIDWRLRRTRYAQPVIHRQYADRMPALDTPLPGIKLAGTAQIYPEDRGMNYAVRLGLQAARSVYRESQSRPENPLEQSDIMLWLYQNLENTNDL